MNDEQLPTPPKHYLSVVEAAEQSGYTVRWIRELIRDGEIQAEKKGMLWIDFDSFSRFLAERANQAKDDPRVGPKSE